MQPGLEHARRGLDEVERAYRGLARRYHPGLNPGDREAAERYRQVEHAYRILADRAQRQAYDRQGTLSVPVGPNGRIAVTNAWARLLALYGKL